MKVRGGGSPLGEYLGGSGIGFGKLFQHNLDLLRQLDDFATIGARLVIGTSATKAFLGTLVGDPSSAMEVRDPGTLATNLWAYTKGASVFRVHDVLAMRRALMTGELQPKEIFGVSQQRSRGFTAFHSHHGMLSEPSTTMITKSVSSWRASPTKRALSWISGR